MTWTQLGTVLEAADAANYDRFGYAVALSADGNVLVVGARDWEGTTGTNRGGVYTYDRSGSTWVQRGSVLQAADAADVDRFGSAVALSADGNVLVVGAYNWEGTTGTDRGVVYTYDRSGSTWVQRGSVLQAADAADFDRFGYAVALSADGNVLVVGARDWEGETGSNRGGVYTYDRSGSTWVQRGSVLQAADAADADWFGSAVALSADGSVLVVGAETWEGTTGTDRGGVYTYDRSGSTWVQRGPVLQAADAADNDRFGCAVALSADGNVLVVGAWVWEGTTGADRGGVYTYDRSGSTWVQRGPVLQAADAADNDYFGISVAISANASVLAVGASDWEGETGVDRGGVYVFTTEAQLPIAIAPISVTVQVVGGAPTAPIKVLVNGIGKSTAPLAVAVIDDYPLRTWTARVILHGADVSARLVGLISVEIEEGGARIAEFTLRPASGPVDPVAWTGRSVSIDALRQIDGFLVPARLFTGVVDVADHDPVTRQTRFRCTDDLQNVVAAMTRADIDALCGGYWSAAVFGEPRDNWDYARDRMSTRTASLDMSRYRALRVTPWHGLTPAWAFTADDVLDKSPSITLPRRADLVNAVDAVMEYRYHRLHQRNAWISWSMPWAGGITAESIGFNFPDATTVMSAVAGAGWLVKQHVTYPAPTAINYAGGKVRPPAGSISAYAGEVVLRYAQPVTERYTLTVHAPGSVTANGRLAREMRGALASTWSPASWEASLSESPSISADQDYAPDAPRSAADAAILTLLHAAQARILASHRQTRVSFGVRMIPELDVDQAASLSTSTIACSGKIYAVSHRLDIDSGEATSTVTLALSGVAAGTGGTSDALLPPQAPNIDAVTGPDSYTLPHHGVWSPAENVYSDALSGWLVDTPESIYVEDVPVSGGGTESKFVPNPYYTPTRYPVNGFRVTLPGVAQTHRAPIDLHAQKTYQVSIPVDPLTLSA